MVKKERTTITFNLSQSNREFYSELSQAGFNRSFLMEKMTRILQELYQQSAEYPGGFHKLLDHLGDWVEDGTLLKIHHLPTSPMTAQERVNLFKKWVALPRDLKGIPKEALKRENMY